MQYIRCAFLNNLWFNNDVICIFIPYFVNVILEITALMCITKYQKMIALVINKQKVISSLSRINNYLLLL